MAVKIEEASMITAKGRITVPKAVRQVLGVQPGARSSSGTRMVVSRSAASRSEHRDPALGSFLRLLEFDIAHGRRIRDLPKGVAASLRRAIKRMAVDLNEPLHGDVDL